MWSIIGFQLRGRGGLTRGGFMSKTRTVRFDDHLDMMVDSPH